MKHTEVSVQEADFDLGAEVLELRQTYRDVGAVVAFLGTVRDQIEASGAGDGLKGLVLEHYPGMTEAAIHAMIAQARQRFDIKAVRIIHRVGSLSVQDQIVMVAVASAHRGQAFSACEYLMDYLKTEAPFWKKEMTPQGGQWVDAKESDDRAAQRWGLKGQGHKSKV